MLEPLLKEYEGAGKIPLGKETSILDAHRILGKQGQTDDYARKRGNLTNISAEFKKAKVR